MSSPKLDLAKREHPSLAPLLDQLMAYIRSQLAAGATFILPKLAAPVMHMNDGEAYVLLELLARAGVMRRAFNVYCKKNDILLGTVESADLLDEIPYCDFCDCQHAASELKLEIAFEPETETNGSLKAA